MSKEGHKRHKVTALRDQMLKLSEKQLSQLTLEEVGSLALAAPVDHPLFPLIYNELERRQQDLLNRAPSPELKELMEYAAKPETFDQYLRETGQTEQFEREIREMSESQDSEQFECVVNEISERTGRMN